MFNIYKHKSNITMVNYAGCDNQLKQTNKKEIRFSVTECENCWFFDPNLSVPEQKGTVMNSLFLVSEQFIYLGFIHILHIFEVQSQLLCLFSFFTIHLQDGVMPLLQILKMHIHTIISKKETAPLAVAAPVYPFPPTEFTLSRILSLGISFTFSSISSFWFVSRTSSSAITARVLSRLVISTCKVFI